MDLTFTAHNRKPEQVQAAANWNNTEQQITINGQTFTVPATWVAVLHASGAVTVMSPEQFTQQYGVAEAYATAERFATTTNDLRDTDRGLTRNLVLLEQRVSDLEQRVQTLAAGTP